MSADSPRTSGQALADLERLTDATLSLLLPEDLLQELLERVSEILESDTAAILLLDESTDMLVARAAKGIEEEVRRGVQVPLGEGFSGRIAAEREPVAIPDINHAVVVNPLLRERGIKSLLGVPLLVEGRVLGVLHVGTLRRREFNDDDVRLLRLAADRAALAIDASRLQEQRGLAEALQRSLVPAILPSIPGIALGGRYLPAASAARLGGDWFDVFRLPDGRLGAVIGDVVGRGVGAAALMAQVRTALRAYALEGHAPATVAERLNDLMIQLEPDRTATLIYLSMDHETDEVAGVSAGHLPPLLIRSDGTCDFHLFASGPPLGATRTARYREVTFDLPTDSTLVLYTDGLIERRGESIEVGMERLRDAVHLEDPMPRPLSDRLLDRLADPVGQEDDDIAILAIRRLELGPRLAVEFPAEPAALASLRRHLSRWLTERGVTGDQAYDIVLASSEASANAIEHAYSPGDASFHVEATLDADIVIITVRDIGRWRAPREGLGGRGLTIMRRLMHEVDVETPPDGGTVVTLRRRVTRGDA
jgi:serine phosphatase RsbU (regulator of sigma subunit)/anti-sigma regulatory factor (Ser/Thr protein kinase)